MVRLLGAASDVGAQVVGRRDPVRDPSAVRGQTGAAVSGAVYDSIAFGTLAGAMVQLVSMESGKFGRTVQADWLGRFAFDSVPDGQYSLGFFHPVLDSLGLDPIVREVHVQDHWSVRANLAVPTRARLRTAVCGPPSATNNGGLVMGIVRDAKARSPKDSVRVESEWVEL